MSGTISGAMSMAPITTAVDSVTTPSEAIADASSIRVTKRAKRTGDSSPSKNSFCWRSSRSSASGGRRWTQRMTERRVADTASCPVGGSAASAGASVCGVNTSIRPMAIAMPAAIVVAAMRSVFGNQISIPPPTARPTALATPQATVCRLATTSPMVTSAEATRSTPTAWVLRVSEPSGSTSSAAAIPAATPMPTMVVNRRRERSRASSTTIVPAQTAAARPTRTPSTRPLRSGQSRMAPATTTRPRPRRARTWKIWRSGTPRSESSSA